MLTVLVHDFFRTLVVPNIFPTSLMISSISQRVRGFDSATWEFWEFCSLAKKTSNQLISPIVARGFARQQPVLPVVTTLVGFGCRTQLGIDHPRDHLCRSLCSAQLGWAMLSQRDGGDLSSPCGSTMKPSCEHVNCFHHSFQETSSWGCLILDWWIGSHLSCEFWQRQDLTQPTCTQNAQDQPLGYSP